MRTIDREGYVIAFSLMFIMLITYASALEFDNVKSDVTYTKGESITLDRTVIAYSDLWEKYKPIEVTNAFGMGSKLVEMALTEHTEDCDGDCKSEFVIVTYNEDVLIQDVSINYLVKDGKELKNPEIAEIPFTLFYQTGTETIMVDDYSYQCDGYSTITNTDGIEITSPICDTVLSGKHEETIPSWKEFKVGEVFPAGDYKVKIESKIKPDYYNNVYDWVVKTNGKTIDEWATWNLSSLNASMIAYWKLDETTGTNVTDSYQAYHGTNVGALVNVAGKIGTAYNFTIAENDRLNMTNNTGLRLVNNFTINAWIKTGTLPAGNGGGIVARATDEAPAIPSSAYNLFIDAKKLTFHWVDNAANKRLGSSSPANLLDNTWYMVTIKKSGTNVTMWMNGSKVDEDSYAGASTNTAGKIETYIGAYGAGTGTWYGYGGAIDEVSLFDRALSDTEIDTLWNSGAGLTFPTSAPDSFPNITMNTVSANYTENLTKTINMTVFDDIKVSNVSLYVNGVLNQTNTSQANNTAYLFDVYLTDGTYTIFGSATDNISQTTNSSSVIFVIESTHPTISANLSNSTLYVAGGNVTLNYLIAHYPNLTGVTAWYGYNGANTTLNTSLYQKNITSVAGQFNITLYANDSAGNQATPVSLIFSNDTTAPTINAVVNTTSLSTWGEPIKLNTTITDTNLDKCWYNYNSINTTIVGCASGVLNQTTITTIENKTSIVVYANDTMGNLNSATITIGLQTAIGVNLISPSNGAVLPLGVVTLNSNGTIGDSSVTFTNATLYDNSTGSWGARNITTNMPLTYQGYCYQESPVVSNQGGLDNNCNLSYNGLITSTTYWSDVTNVYDGNWNSLGNSSGRSTYQFVYLSYQKPTNAINSTIQIKTSTNFTNLSVPSTCWNYNSSHIIIRLGSYKPSLGTESGNDISCQNGTSDYYSFITTYSATNFTYSYIYEDAMIWYIQSNISINNQNYYPEGSYKWNVQYALNNSTSYFAPTNYTFSIDATAPTIALNSPSLYNYSKVGDILQINFTATDSHLDKVWYDYNGTNITIAGATSGVVSSINISATSDKDIIVYANDTVGNLNYTTFSWNYNVFNNYITYDASAYETAEETFVFSGLYNYPTISNLNLYLNYNGVSYPATESLDAGTLNATVVLNIPEGAGSKIFNWTIEVVGAGYNLTSQSLTQTVLSMPNITIATNNCSAGLYPAFYFTFADEQNLTALSADVDYNIQYSASADGLLRYIYGNLTGVNNFTICINSSFSNYYVRSGEIQYDAANYAARKFYIFQNTRLTNNTVNDTLYLLPASVATAFKVNAISSTVLAYADYYIGLLRWYPSLNQYYVVDMGKTDENGDASIYVKTQDADYRLALYEKDGSLIKLVNSTRFVCQSYPCTYNIIVTSTETDLTTFLNVETAITYDPDTKVFTFTWNDPSQDTDSMNFTVWKDGAVNSTVICSQTVNSFTGILTCNVTGYTGTVRAEAWRTASPMKLIAQDIQRIGDLLIDIPNASGLGLFFGVVMVVLFAFVGIFNPILAIILAVIAFVPLYFMGSISILIFSSIAVMGGIVIHFLRRVS